MIMKQREVFFLKHLIVCNAKGAPNIILRLSLEKSLIQGSRSLSRHQGPLWSSKGQ